MKKQGSLIFVSIIFVLLSSCSDQPIKFNAYNGSALPSSQQGILKCAPYIRIISIDKDKRYKVAPQTSAPFVDCEIGLVPGTHTVEICYEDDYGCERAAVGLIPLALRSMDISQGASNCFPVDVKIDVLAGHYYRIKSDITIQKSCKPAQTSYSQYGTITTPGIEKEYTASLTIDDETNTEIMSNKYDQAKNFSDKAKASQKNGDWKEAIVNWKSALENAISGNLDMEIQMTLYNNYANALTVTCNYPEALVNINKAYDIGNKNEWQSENILLAYARINLITKNTTYFENSYKLLESKYSNILSQGEIEFSRKVALSQNIDSSVIANRLREIDRNISYGKYCN